jgi:hypothetical protein
MRLILLTSALVSCRTTVVEVQVYVTGEQGDPLDTGLVTATLDDTGDTTDTEAVPTAEPQGLLAVDADAGVARVFPSDSSATDLTWTLPDVAGLDLALADLDGDGLDDLWGRDAASKTMTVWLQTAEGGFNATPAWEEFTNISEVREVLVGDFNGDGAADLATWVDESNLLHVFAGTGSSVDLVTVADSTLAGVFPGAWFVADVNADGQDDAVRVGDDRVAAWRSVDGILERNPGLDQTLTAPIDLLVEADGLYGADLAGQGELGLDLLLADGSGWSGTRAWDGPTGTLLLAGSIGD